jgi:cytochrome c oxidase subunit I+III
MIKPAAPSSMPQAPAEQGAEPARHAGQLDSRHEARFALHSWHWLCAVDHRSIGLRYLATALLFLLAAGVLALLMRVQLAVPDAALLQGRTYSQLFTLHGVGMVYLFAIPVVQALAICLVPAMLGARDLPFPRLTAFAYWTYALGGLVLFATLLSDSAPDGGWLMAPPLSSYRHSPALNVDFWLFGVALLAMSALAVAVALSVSILRTRAPRMSLQRMPIYAWSILVAMPMLALAGAPMLVAAGLLALERAWRWPFFIVEKGGDALLWEHLLRLSGPVGVCAVLLPAAGLVSTMLPALARARLAGHRWIVVALTATAAVGAMLWSYQVSTATLPHLALGLLPALAAAIAIPGSVHLSAWLATISRGRLRADVPSLFILGFLFTMTVSAVAALMLAVPPIDRQAQDSYFAVAQLHYFAVGVLLFPLWAAVYFWGAAVSRRPLSVTLGRCAFGLMFVGLHLAFLPMYLLGLAGMPRRVYTYAAGLGWDTLNLTASLGAAVIALGVCVVLLDLLLHLRPAARIDADPWSAPGLEWLPRHRLGTASIPEVRSRYPLWDQSGLREEVERGLHFLPATAACTRQTLVTSARAARPDYVLVLPGPSALPLGTAVCCVVLLLLLVLDRPVPAAATAVLLLTTVFAWLWRTDRPVPSDMIDAGSGRTLPAYRTGPRAHSWWAMSALLLLDAAGFLSLASAYVYLWSTGGQAWPPLEQPLPILTSGVGAVVLWVTSSAFVAYAGSALQQRSRVLLSMTAALVLNLAALALTAYGFLSVGLDPRMHAYAAIVGALLAYQALHAVLVVMMVAYVGARVRARLLDARRRAAFDNVRLFWHYSVVQGVAAVALLYVFPRVA